ncbi:MAG: hypothetical protein V3T72_06940, partial [Thermoanaerobaculia bacterium]
MRKLLSLPQGEDDVALRDRAILAVMFYSAARIAAVQALEVDNFYVDDNGAELCLREKGDRVRIIGL